jgi:L-fucose isomerase
MSTKRLIGQAPRVGIRPTIDGRLEGVRESLEEQTMQMARSAAALIESTLKHADGSKVECVIADTCIGGVAEAAATADKFSRAGVGVSLTVTPCWCYGSETIDMDPLLPKAIWGFNGTERPGAVYLAAALAGHNQKGLPAFGIYGKDVQDSGDTEIPDDVREKILTFVRAGLAVATMKGKSYLSMGSVSMGIAGSIVDADFFEDYLGMRCEYADMSEFTRRIEEGIFDPEELTLARDWIKKNCKEGKDYNPAEIQKSPEKKAEEWEFVAKMALIGRDLMVGNPKLRRWASGKRPTGTMPLLPGSRDNASGPITFPTGTLWRRYCAPPLIGTGSDNPICWPRKTTA